MRGGKSIVSNTHRHRDTQIHTQTHTKTDAQTRQNKKKHKKKGTTDPNSRDEEATKQDRMELLVVFRVRERVGKIHQLELHCAFGESKWSTQSRVKRRKKERKRIAEAEQNTRVRRRRKRK